MIRHTQQKYNLFREESEGYSKLIVELQNSSALNSKQLFDSICAIIGFYDLDPIRCYGVILESLESDLNNQLLIELVSYIIPSALPNLIGFKYQYYQVHLRF